MRLSFTTLDVFTATRYTGNPLAIVKVPNEYSSTLTQSQKQSIAKEFNLSETVFIHETEGEVALVDIFTHEAEIPFAGHPTIGSGYFLLKYQQKAIKALQTKAGRIPVSLEVSDGQVRANIPHNIHVHSHTATSDLNGKANPTVSVVKGMTFILVCLPDLEALGKATRNLHGNTYDPAVLDEGWREGLLATMYYVPLSTDASGRCSYRTRMHGSREDPATGSASSALASFLALQEPVEKSKGPFMYAFTQGVEMGSKSDIEVEVVRDNNAAVESVVLCGTAVRVMEGSLEVD
jgi:PhzF family phenazine biosynthesis protein